MKLMKKVCIGFLGFGSGSKFFLVIRVKVLR